MQNFVRKAESWLSLFYKVLATNKVSTTILSLFGRGHNHRFSVISPRICYRQIWKAYGENRGQMISRKNLWILLTYFYPVQCVPFPAHCSRMLTYAFRMFFEFDLPPENDFVKSWRLFSSCLFRNYEEYCRKSMTQC